MYCGFIYASQLKQCPVWMFRRQWGIEPIVRVRYLNKYNILFKEHFMVHKFNIQIHFFLLITALTWKMLMVFGVHSQRLMSTLKDLCPTKMLLKISNESRLKELYYHTLVGMRGEEGETWSIHMKSLEEYMLICWF